MKRMTRLSKGGRSRKISRLVHQNPFGDYDRDGVPNIYDCVPTNPKKHGVEPYPETFEPTFAEKAQTKLWSRAGAVMKGEIPAKGD
jgi:hypothetical protein